MNIFRSLMGKVWLIGSTFLEDPNAAEVVKINAGQLFLVRPGNIRSSRECLYPEAMVTVRRVPSVEHNFQLVVTRVFEEEDQEILEDEDETDEERVFLISEELEFRTGEADGEPTFIWRDLEGDVDELYEFVAQGTNPPMKAFFETCMYHAMYERKYKVNPEEVKDAKLDEFMWKPPSPTKPHPRRKVPVKVPSTSSVEEVPPPASPSSDKAKSKAKSKAKAAASELDSATSLMETEAELYYWEPEENQFTHQGVVVARLVTQPGTFHFLITASTEEGPLLAHPLSPSMNPRWSGKMNSVTWNFVQEDRVDGWLFRFPSEEVYAQFLDVFTQCAWESLHQIPWNKLKEDEKNYIRSSTNEDVVMKDVDEDEEDEEEVESELDPDRSDDEDESEYEEDEDAPTLPGEANSQLVVGYKGNRSYVVRGNNIGVFAPSDDQPVKYQATISKLSTPKGKEFKPKHLMLHDQDTKMVLMNPNEPNSLFSMDVERGKIVEEWKVHDDVTVDHIAPDNKFAQMTPEQTLVGASHNALFRIDPRVSGNKMVDSQYKQYVSKNKFSGVATTSSGKLAVASEKGDIRLFDSIGKNAKTALPPLGDPIIGVDVTSNGRYLVATTKTYLLLIDTLIGEGRYAGSLGFDRSFPATAKPQPRRLTLKNEHVAYMNQEISFTPARFNFNEGQEENAIVTSTGPFVIAWDFAKVKKGVVDKYEIKKYEDAVVQDNWRINSDQEIIVALKNNVLGVTKKELKKPTRKSLAPASRSSIVNSPY
ncbi:Vacuolar import and degradation protein 27 [Marasmius tenuissimus]|uniref:Vacuolar import and degradation protein 27 n=1 Tax=Marasmius tenuissimus TaxID=585030 RepID=A0ABR3ACK7_9AGAR